MTIECYRWAARCILIFSRDLSDESLNIIHIYIVREQTIRFFSGLDDDHIWQ